MTQIKICGLTRREDIVAVNRLRPEYVGFVFAKSRRQVTPEQARELWLQLDEGIQAVGVFVDESVERVAAIARQIPLDVIQLHGGEDAGYMEALRRKAAKPIWKAIRVRDTESLTEMQNLRADRYLLDTYIEGQKGGGGVPFDWSCLAGLEPETVVLAGGLEPGNVGVALRQTHPFAVDVSSGVETDGCKDPKKIEAFMDIVRGKL